MNHARDVAAITGWAVIIVAAIAATAYLGTHGHPFLAFGCLILAGSIGIKTTDKGSEGGA